MPAWAGLLSRHVKNAYAPGNPVIASVSAIRFVPGSIVPSPRIELARFMNSSVFAAERGTGSEKEFIHIKSSTVIAGIALAIGGVIASVGAMADGMPAYGKMAAASAGPAGFNWSGLYAGGNIGGVWSNVDHNLTFSTGATEKYNFDKNSFAGGGQFIYQGQWGNFVIGTEISLTGFNLADRTRTSDIDWLFTLSTRLGYAVNNWLVYVKGGYAGADVYRGGGVASSGFQITGTNRHEDGLTFGGGFEMAMSPFATLGLDYSYVNIEPISRLASPQYVAPGVTVGQNKVGDVEFHLLTARLNFKLGQ